MKQMNWYLGPIPFLPEGEGPDSPSNEDFSGPQYKRRGINHDLSVNRLYRQHGCPPFIIGINKDFNEK